MCKKQYIGAHLWPGGLKPHLFLYKGTQVRAFNAEKDT